MTERHGTEPAENRDIRQTGREDCVVDILKCEVRKKWGDVEYGAKQHVLTESPVVRVLAIVPITNSETSKRGSQKEQDFRTGGLRNSPMKLP